ncbi:hypothetical protein SBRCBS47491_005855 [Sporothrix bragantina]|uniref:Uncharacterized protein n=1 Tax=Sporothrix bragantina TaxID=671064 RepID=A0ABP0C0G2_9PEZI
MSSNNGNSNASGGGGDSDSNDRNELFIAIAALAISVVALIIAVLQALQQYFASAEGYSQCSEKTIGRWSKFTKRKLLLKQFRFEVRFRVPVIFVAPPYNRFGPLGDDTGVEADIGAGKEIVYVDGSSENYRKTHTWTPEEYDFKREKLKGTDSREAIHTADNEMTTWLALLMAIQRMERESREWQDHMARPYVAPVDADASKALVLADNYGGHTMVVGVQEKTRSWDTMPDGLKKPYATTAMCHLVEIVAMLGIHWKEFDRRNNVYRAQGNGFLVTGSMVPNLGVAFTFEKVGKTWFQENRIVPNDSVKQLCFGFCPTIFQAGLKTPLYTDEPKDEGTLQLATRAEVAETLVSFNCNTNTVNYFRLGNEHTRYSHLFPVTFEMLGMVGEVMQIHRTMFTMLPNPTFFTWNKAAFSLIGLMQGFRRSLDDADKEERLFRRGSHLAAIRADMDRIIAVALEDDEQRRKDEVVLADRRRLDEVKKMAEANKYILLKRGPAKATLPQKSVWVRAFERVGRGIKHAFVKIGTSLRYGFLKLLFKLHLTKNDPADETPFIKQRELASNTLERESFPRYLEQLHHAIKRCDLFLAHNYDLVQHVFALHMQEVLCYLNSRPNSPDDEPHESPVTGGWPTGSPGGYGGGYGYGSGAGGGGGRAQRGPASHIYTPSPDNTEYYNDKYIALHAIDTASWTMRHRMLMQLYVTFIRKRVADVPIPAKVSVYTQVKASKEKIAALTRQDSSALSALADIPEGSLASSTSSRVPTGGIAAAINVGVAAALAGAPVATAAAAVGSAAAAPAVTHEEAPSPGGASVSSTGGSSVASSAVPEAPTGTSTTAATAAAAAAFKKKNNPEKDTIQRATTVRDIEDIWCTLTFRMLCWLMLHDFHKKDVQVSKSDVYDSRLAVYLL